MQISDIFHNCPEQEQQEQQQQCNPKDLGSKFPRSKSFERAFALSLQGSYNRNSPKTLIFSKGKLALLTNSYKNLGDYI